MRKKRRAEEPDNTDRWVVSYADFITLLFAFFTVMYAISHVDAGKLSQFSGSMQSALKTSSTDTSTKALIEGIKPISYEDLKLEKDVKAAFEKSGIMSDVSVYRNERGVLISFGDGILFEAGSAELRPEALPLLTVVAAVIQQTQNSIAIEGHTDNLPIKNARYASNWELSTARATSVLITLLRDYQFSPERFSASGYGEYRPMATNATPDGRAKNRRVDIIFGTTKEKS
jgi:chemotaxis protein MotB